MTKQIENGFPGLAQECKQLIKELDLPDITEESIKQKVWKKLVKRAIVEKNEKELKKEIEKMSKVKEFSTEAFQRKDYFKNLNLEDARTIFKQRAKMTQYVKWNFKNDPKYLHDLWKCTSCQSSIDTQSHILWCESYKKLREEKDLSSNKDLAQYIQEVLRIRSELNIMK